MHTGIEKTAFLKKSNEMQFHFIRVKGLLLEKKEAK